MRMLLSTYGSRGDVEPFAALAVALQQHGVEAIVSAPGDAEFVELLARADVPLAPAFMPVRDWIEAAKSMPRDIRVFAAKMAPLQYEAIDRAAEGCDAILATGLMPSVGAAHAVAEKRGLRYAHVSLCPLYLPSHHHKPHAYPGHPFPEGVTDARAMWAWNARVMNDLFGAAINAVRIGASLPPIDDVRAYCFGARPFLAADAALWPFEATDLCDPVQTGAWILPDTRTLPPELVAFLDAGAPPIYAGFGSIAIAHAKDTAEAAIRAARAHGRRLVLARGWAGMAAMDASDDVFAVGDVNQQKLFERVAATLHHGGAGTTTAAARAGTPQIVVPQIADQPYWGERVALLGAGVAHDGPSPTFDSLNAALSIVLSPETKAHAAALASRMKGDGADRAAQFLIERIVA